MISDELALADSSPTTKRSSTRIEYVRGNTHTNTVEGFFAARCINGRFTTPKPPHCAVLMSSCSATHRQTSAARWAFW